MLNDLRYNTGKIKRSSVLQVLKINIDELLAATPLISDKPTSNLCKSILPAAGRYRNRTRITKHW